jgi:hypothetical protein
VCESSPPSSCWPYTDEIYFKKSFFFFFFFFFILSLLPLTSNNRDKTVNLNELKQDNKRREKKRKKENGKRIKNSLAGNGERRKSVDPPQRDSGSIQTIKTMCVSVT